MACVDCLLGSRDALGISKEVQECGFSAKHKPNLEVYGVVRS